MTVVRGEPTPAGWAGKVWALAQGVRASDERGAELLLFTDADVVHGPGVVRGLVAKAREEDLDLVSLMARLRVSGPLERLLVPAFVYFFGKLYPFRWVNDPSNATAAAAGGCILVRRESLQRSGGLESIHDRLIDDCALAERISLGARPDGGRLWLGLSAEVRSVRVYGGLPGVWRMVARSAFTQLRYSPLLLAGTVFGMLLTYLAPVVGGVAGLIVVSLDPGAPTGWLLTSTGVGAWGLMSASFVPTLRHYRTSTAHAPLLPVAGTLYTLMTVDSAVRFWTGRGGGWKGRTYDPAALRRDVEDSGGDYGAGAA